jgi:hypothetical protein
MDQEAFTDTAQNTGKFSHAFTTLTATSSAAGLLTNSGNITTTTTGMTFGSFAQFPIGGTNTLVVETALSFSAQPNSNTVIDFGVFQRGASTAFLGLDGVYFRMNSTGLSGVINNAGVETTTGVFPLALGTGTFAYTNNRVYRFLIQITNVVTTFWIDNLKVGEIPTPAGADSPCQSRSLPWSIRHAIVGGAAGAATQALVKDYRVSVRGPQYANVLSTSGNRMFGSYQGLSGGTMGSLATYANSTNPTAAAPSNTALTANLPGGLGGQGAVTAAAAAATDGIWGSYQVPAGSTTVQGRRLVVRGVRLQCINNGAAVAFAGNGGKRLVRHRHGQGSAPRGYGLPILGSRCGDWCARRRGTDLPRPWGRADLRQPRRVHRPGRQVPRRHGDGFADDQLHLAARLRLGVTVEPSPRT